MNCNNNPLLKKFKSYLMMAAPALPEFITDGIQSYLDQANATGSAHVFFDALGNQLQTETQDEFERALFALAFAVTSEGTDGGEQAEQFKAYMIEQAKDSDSDFVGKVLYAAQVFHATEFQGPLHVNVLLAKSVQYLLESESPQGIEKAKQLTAQLFISEPTAAYDAFSLAQIIKIMRKHQTLSEQEAIGMMYSKINGLSSYTSKQKGELFLDILGYQDNTLKAEGTARMIFRQPPFTSQDWDGVSSGMATNFTPLVITYLKQAPQEFEQHAEPLIDTLHYEDQDLYRALWLLASDQYQKYSPQFLGKLKDKVKPHLFHKEITEIDKKNTKKTSMAVYTSRAYIYLLLAQAQSGDATAENEILDLVWSLENKSTAASITYEWAIEDFLSKHSSYSLSQATTKKLYAFINDWHKKAAEPD